MIKHYADTEQISEIKEYKFKLPKYGKSTTDPTYYEPAATRIANMKKASGMILEGIYDFYTKDDVSKFNEKNFSKNINSVSPDYKFVKGLTQEEVSQVSNTYSQKAESMLENKKEKANKKAERINEQIEVSNIINNQSDSTEG